MIQILTISRLYPNELQLQYGIFVEQRLRHLVSTKEIESRVIAPLPWFPFASSYFGRYGIMAKVPKIENRFGIQILHPRFLHFPKIGMAISPILLALAMIRVLRNLINAGFHFELIDAHYFYPDGVAAAILGKIFNKPVIITGRGSDINLIPKYTLPRKQIIWAAQQSAALITVSYALKDELSQINIPSDKITVLRNGVDLKTFSPVDHDEARQRLNITRKTILSVGNLVSEKGHDITIEALKYLPGVKLIIVGEGELKENLIDLAERLGVSARVRLVGAIPQAELKYYYNAVDLLVLASIREGMPNVVLESMACGTPIVASKVGGIPEIVQEPVAGCLVKERTALEFSKAISTVLHNNISRSDIRRYAEKYSWQQTSQGQLDLFRKVINNRSK